MNLRPLGYECGPVDCEAPARTRTDDHVSGDHARRRRLHPRPSAPVHADLVDQILTTRGLAPRNNLQIVVAWSYILIILVEWPDDFDRWLTAIEEAGGPVEEITFALLEELAQLESKPGTETATFK